MVVAQWYKGHVSGWMLAIAAIGLQIAAAWVSNDPARSASVVRWSAWLTTGAAVYAIFVAQYDAWRAERKKFESELAKNSLPEIVGEIRTATATPFTGGGLADNLLHAGSHLLTFTLSIRNVRPVDTNIAGVKFEALRTRPMLFIFDVSACSQQGPEIKRPGEVILRRGMLVELVVTAFTKFPESYEFPQSSQIEFSGLDALVTDGFGGIHRITARSGLKLYVLGAP